MIHGFRAAVLASALVLGAQGGVAAPYYVTTGQSHANTQIDVSHSSTWLLELDAGSGLELGGGDFTIKRGQHTALPITLSLYEGTDASGLLVDRVSVLPAAVTQAYGLVHFGFAAPVVLEGGVDGASYFLALTSTTADAGSRQYFIKGEEATVLGFGGASGLRAEVASGQATVPEPVSSGLLGAALLGLGLAWRRRASR